MNDSDTIYASHINISLPNLGQVNTKKNKIILPLLLKKKNNLF